MEQESRGRHAHACTHARGTLPRHQIRDLQHDYLRARARIDRDIFVPILRKCWGDNFVEGFAHVVAPRGVSGVLGRVARSAKFFVSPRDPRKCARSFRRYIILFLDIL